MRLLLRYALLALLVSSCTPEIPVRPGFGVSALTPTGNIPPEFIEFNNYDPQVNALLADQMCATPFVRTVDNSVSAVPGEIIAASGHCETHRPFVGN
jgi:hypothetical protein